MQKAKLYKSAITLLLAITSALLVEASPPKAVSEMSKKELKIHSRDVKKYSFETQINKDKASGITWIESPSISNTSTPSMRHFIRVAIKDGKPITHQIIVTHTHQVMTEYDRKSMDYTGSRIGTIKLPTEAGEPLRDPAADTKTQISSITITQKMLRESAETGIELWVTNTFGDTEVPIEASLVSAFLIRYEKVLKAK